MDSSTWVSFLSSYKIDDKDAHFFFFCKVTEVYSVIQSLTPHWCVKTLVFFISKC